MGARILRFLLLGLACVAAQARALASDVPGPPAACSADIRSSLAWGVATAAYQVEGAWNSSGRSPSVWDVFAHVPGNIVNNDNGDVACDMYHKYDSDFAMMKRLGIKHYRFSFSWSRILPGGKAGSPVNAEGVAFYNRLIDSMIAHGIKPYATIFHWDLPQVLQDEYQGFISPAIVDDYVAYAALLFESFGDRVADWMTFNEPWITCTLQWGRGDFAPGINYGPAGQYACGHHVLLAHGRTKALYDARFRATQGGRLGMALNIEYLEPLTDAPEHVAAAKTGLEGALGWFADPLTFGDYPESLKRCAAPHLPAFTPETSALVKGSLDFMGINFYTGKYAKGSTTDACVVQTSEVDVDGAVIGAQAQSVWLRVVPWAFYKLLKYVDDRYHPGHVVITENGVSAPGEAGMAAAEATADAFRLDYYKGYLDNLCKAVAEGVKIKTYFAWSFMDNFEWRQGYSERFGIVHVDFASPALTRTLKDSGRWLAANFFRTGAGWQRQQQQQAQQPQPAA